MDEILALPAGPLARAALDLAQQTESSLVADHSIRSFLFARLLANRDGSVGDAAYDENLLFAASARQRRGSGPADEARLPTDLVAAFTEMGPAWGRWVQACLPDDTASYARLRVLTALECDGDRTMKQLAEALEVTPRRITALVDALEEHRLVERYAHPTDGRSTLVAITDEGLEQQRLGWQQHQDKVAVAFADLPAGDQARLLAISRDLTAIFRRRLARQSPDDNPGCTPSRGMARSLTRRRKADNKA